MKTRRLVKVFYLMAAVSLIFCFYGTSASAKPIELSYANMFPPTHIQSKLPESWCKEVEKRTNGKVKITYYPGQTLLKGPKIYSGVVDGIADIGTSVLGYSRGVFPAMEAIDLPMGYPSGEVATKVINAFYEKFKPKSFANVKPMYFHAHGPGILHSKKPVTKLEDLKGMKIRSYGFNAKMTAALGAVPVAMSQAGVYEALQKGVADATFSPSEVLKGWKQAEVVKSTTKCYSVGYTAGFFVVMNLDKWNSLPKDVQEVIEEINKEWVAKYGDAWANSDKEGLEFSLSLGNKVLDLSPEESARWAKAVAPVVDAYIKAADGKGLPGKEYVDFIRAKIKEYSK
ncbi:TRAP transporter substrate-binding protein [Thermodesulfobacteriota bacterium]